MIIIEADHTVPMVTRSFEERQYTVLRQLKLAGIVVFINGYDSLNFLLDCEPMGLGPGPANVFIGLSNRMATFLMDIFHGHRGPLVALFSENLAASHAQERADLFITIGDSAVSDCDCSFKNYAQVTDFLAELARRALLRLE